MGGKSQANELSGTFQSNGQLWAGNFINTSGGNINFGSINDDPCLRALRVTDPRADRDRIVASKNKLLREAYEWIFQDNNYQLWRDRPDINLLWVKGDPGKGKTMLICALIAEMSQQIERGGLPGRLAFFLCQATDNRLHSAGSILRGLLFLLALSDDYIHDQIRREFDIGGPDLFDGPNAFFDLRRIFVQVLENYTLDTIYLLVDALDECTSNLKEFLDLIGSDQLTHVKWIVSSRNRLDIETRLRSKDNRLRLSLEMEQRHVTLAVDAFITWRVHELAENRCYDDYDEKLQQELAQHLHMKAEGTFLWVALVCKALEEIEAWDVLSEIEQFPSGLQPLYDRMMDQLESSSDGSRCKKILLSVSLAFRPMHLRELGVTLDLPDTLRRNIQVLRRLVNLCASFLTIRDDTVFFIHQSAKDYFTTGSGSRFMLDKEEAHGEMTTRLLEILSKTLKMDILDMSTPWITLDKAKSHLNIQKIEHVRYACCHWVDHLGSSTTRVGWAIINEFLKNNILFWFEALSLMEELSGGVFMILHLQKLINGLGTWQKTELESIVYDARRFILNSRAIIESAPLQTYSSALVFSPRTSVIRQLFGSHIPKWITKLPSVDESWNPLLLTLEGHTDQVNDVKFSPSATQLASSSSDKTIRIWEVATGKTLSILRGHEHAVQSISFSPDRRHLAAASSHTIWIWDFTIEKLITIQVHTNIIQSLAFSPDGSKLAAGSLDKTVRVWKIEQGATLNILETGIETKTLSFSRDGNYIAVASAHREYQLWDLTTGSRTEKFSSDIYHPAPDSGSCFSTISSQTEAAEDFGTILNWQVQGNYSVHISEDYIYPAEIPRVISYGGEVVDTWKRITRSWPLSKLTPSCTLEGHTKRISALALSPDGETLASASYDRTIRLWNAAAKAPQARSLEHKGSVCSLAISPDRSKIASGGFDETVCIWDLENDELIFKFDHFLCLVNSLAFSHDGSYLVSGSGNEPVVIWNLTTRELRKQIFFPAYLSNVVSISADGKLIAIGCETFGDTEIHIWDWSTESFYRTLQGHSHPVMLLDFSPDGMLLASAAEDNTIRVWDIMTAEEIHRFDLPEVSFLSFSSDGDYLHCSSGIISLRSQSPIESGNLQPPQGLYVKDNWIFYGAQKILWLHPDYRPVTKHSVVAKDNILAIGHASGRVSTIKFDLSQIAIPTDPNQSTVIENSF